MMGFKELMKAKSFGEYFDAKKDPEKMEEIKNRSATEVVKNSGKSLIEAAEANKKYVMAFGFTLTSKTIEKSFETKSLEGVVARVESGSELQSRVTMTRLVALGVFAFAAKKKKGGEKYLTIEGPDFVWTSEVKRDKKDINKAMDFVAKVNTNAKKFAPISNVKGSSKIESTAPSIADELKKFKELLDIGAITKEEFDKQKSKLLD